MAEEMEGAVKVPIVWCVPDDLESKYATNVVVQKSEHEFIINFFEMERPIIFGDDPDVVMRQWEEIESVCAKCVARIVVAEERMPGFIEAMQKNLERGSGEEGDE